MRWATLMQLHYLTSIPLIYTRSSRNMIIVWKRVQLTTSYICHFVWSVSPKIPIAFHSVSRGGSLALCPCWPFRISLVSFRHWECQRHRFVLRLGRCGRGHHGPGRRHHALQTEPEWLRRGRHRLFCIDRWLPDLQLQNSPSRSAA